MARAQESPASRSDGVMPPRDPRQQNQTNPSIVREKTFAEEYREFLRENGIPFEEKYLLE
jgi:hypothetical protein